MAQGTVLLRLDLHIVRYTVEKIFGSSSWQKRFDGGDQTNGASIPQVISSLKLSSSLIGFDRLLVLR